MKKWTKLQYENKSNATVNRVSTERTETASDRTHLVLACTIFLLSNPFVLPDYNVFKVNCKCFAMWCKTGKWCTLQSAALMFVGCSLALTPSLIVGPAVAATRVVPASPLAPYHIANMYSASNAICM
eukprot:195980-Ditylum_brightwellii.AAC.2